MPGFLKKLFASSAPLSPVEQELKRWNIKYQREEDGRLVVKEDVDLSGRQLTELPDFSSVQFLGSFDCSHNNLVSLKGAPQIVHGNFMCYANQLTSLEHGPQIVGMGFCCNDNQLTSLRGGPPYVRWLTCCARNPLENTEHINALGILTLPHTGTRPTDNEPLPEKKTSPVTRFIL